MPRRRGALSAAEDRDIDLLFVATLGYEPNAHAAAWLVHEVLPHLPEVTVALVGAAPPPFVRDLAGPRVIVAADVPDVTPWYERSRACVVPIHAGAGTRTKIPEAWAHRRPVISTTLGAEGLAIDGIDAVASGVLLADDPASFATACARVLDDPALEATLVDAGVRRYQRAHAREVAVAHADAAVDAALTAAGRIPPTRVRP